MADMKARKAAIRAAAERAKQPDKDGFQYYHGREALVLIEETPNDN